MQITADTIRYSDYVYKLASDTICHCMQVIISLSKFLVFKVDLVVSLLLSIGDAR